MGVRQGVASTNLADVRSDREEAAAHALLHDAPDIELGSSESARAIATTASPDTARAVSRATTPAAPAAAPPVASLVRRSSRGTSRVAAPLFFLLATGACLGLSTNLAKLAGSAGLPPLAFLAWSVCGASVVLFVLAAARGELPPLNGRTAEYFVLSAFVTVAASNLIFVSATPRVGAGFVAPVAALPPLLTYVGALALGLERFRAGRAAGVVLALGGAAWIAFVELSVPDAATFWIGLTLVAPVLLAIGNLYRTSRWPPGLSAESLAPGMLGASALMLLGAGLVPHSAFSLAVPTDRMLPSLLVLAQTAVFAAQFVLLLELQRRGGPVYLSLIGSVGALVGVPVAVLLLGERLPAGFAPGALLIGLGVALLNTGRGRRARLASVAGRGRGSRRRRRRRRRTDLAGFGTSAPAPPVELGAATVSRTTAVQPDSRRRDRRSTLARPA